MPKLTPKKNLTLAGPPRLGHKKLVLDEAGLSRFAKNLAKEILRSSSQPRRPHGVGAPTSGKRTRASEENATVIALSGELGAGKTTFAKAFLKALGVRESVTSPTFILFRPYPIPVKQLRSRRSLQLNSLESKKLPNSSTAQLFRLAYHIDCYRLEDPKELLKLGLKEMLADPRHIVVIEWAERIKKYLPKNSIWIKLEHGKQKNLRLLRSV